MGDGGKWVCDPYRLKSRLDCLVYSVGSNGDFGFEVNMKKTMPHCEIHTFDQNQYSCPNGICIFHQITFGNGIHPPGSKNWTTIIQELNHTQRKIDILKIDIEGIRSSSINYRETNIPLSTIYYNIDKLKQSNSLKHQGENGWRRVLSEKTY
ncbi:unnamed protein product [Rotaria sordida]|uniref:Methyltransferase domain-containing protein n=1 Tax=Rotaria sordida TaxID=392033 RepID=A0A815QB58_9BILA|nr:unnamed protein product [Rotaria sordida]CAF3744143.1 unnamed protein product [Rotaria sordida]